VRACVSNESYTISAEVDRGFHGETADETRILTGLHRNVPLGRPADDQVMTLCRSPSGHLRSFGTTNLFAVCVALNRAVLTSLSPSERM
jgi:hypothetical protein